MNFGLMGVTVEIVFSLSSKRISPELPIVYDNNTFPALRELFDRPDAGPYIKASSCRMCFLLLADMLLLLENACI
jgi:hypothetical protein